MSARAGYPPLTIGLCAVAALGALCLAATLAPTWVATPEMPTPRALASISIPEFEQPTFDRYAVIADRPLFAPDRRSESAAAGAPGTGQSQLSDYRLAGVIISKDASIALVERLASHQVVTVHPGDDLDGRHVEDITADGVALRDARGLAMLSIPKPKSPGWRYAGNNQ
jgi:hypothetical protein